MDEEELSAGQPLSAPEARSVPGQEQTLQPLEQVLAEARQEAEGQVYVFIP